ncbi:acetate--CoA ligase [Bartonella sp. DGB1]|uniref:acetate--CoA ligase n=1 Tax=Bartonella sp. DGB1 TaxID=3239807 RepID=UPI00352338AE
MIDKIYPVPESIKKEALIDKETYEQWYKESINDPETFWGKHGKRIDWIKPYTKIKNTSFEGDVSIKWYEDGTTNVAYNCIDRHLKTRGDQVALIWEGDNPEHSKKVTYKELHKEVCKFANVLKKNNVKKGDCVTIYLPMIVEGVYAMLACARIGAIHSVVFGGFSPDSLAKRMIDCESKIAITADYGIRGGQKIPLKNNLDAAIEIAKNENFHIDRTIVIKNCPDETIDWNQQLDRWYHEEVKSVTDDCEIVEMNAEDPLFVLYTSGSTGKPKGVLHTTAGYLVYASMTHQYVFDYHDGDIYWCTADIGWITGHSYVVYGPLANGATSLIFEGTPTYPDASRFWQIIDKYKVNIFYTAPTAIRALMGMGDKFLANTSRDSLKILASVGEPINPEAWEWFYQKVGKNHAPIMDTWWQTETGGHAITPLPGVTPLKPGAASFPFFGIKPVLADQNNNPVEGEGEGSLCIDDSWPGQMRSLYKDHARFIETYFAPYKGRYCSGDGARRDKDGYYWITGRLDDVLNVSGHRLGTAEIESALVAHATVAEAAVVGVPHDVKGQSIYCFVTLMNDFAPSEELKAELIAQVRKEIGALATPDTIQFASGLPKTRSGKIMRRILRKVAVNEFENLGDISTLAEPAVVEDLIKNRELV